MAKTLIVYATKYGSTASCAWKLAKLIESEVKIIDLSQDSPPKLDDFKQIIIGSPVYVGQLQAEVEEFCQQNLELLLTKQTGLFICGWSGDCFEDKINNLFPLSLATKSVVGYFGGQIKLEELTAIEQIAIEKALEEQSRPQIIEENIVLFAEQLA